MRSSHRSLEILLVHIMSYPTRCFAQYDCPQIPSNPQIIPHYMSRQRSRRFFSGYHKGQSWREKRFRLFQERGGVCGDCGATLSLDAAAHHVLPRSGDVTWMPTWSCSATTVMQGGTKKQSSKLPRTPQPILCCSRHFFIVNGSNPGQRTECDSFSSSVPWSR